MHFIYSLFSFSLFLWLLLSTVSCRDLTHYCTNVKKKAVSYRGLTTVSRKKLNKKTGCRGQATA
ncbi:MULTISPECIES: hypothetical protein [unclassified Rickettsia]|uniref:hypothetical protein n=1 Tax=unclassified Rickettsia TaxID=114295 RepID=UPI00313341CB